MPIVIPCSEVTPAMADRVGGRALALVMLRGIVDAVPPWIVISAEAFRQVLARDGLDQRITSRLMAAQGSPEHEAEAAAEVRGWVETLAIPEDMWEAIERSCSETLGRQTRVALRPSPVIPEGGERPPGRTHDTYLFLRQPETVRTHLAKVWASAFADRALAEMRQARRPVTDLAMAVIVQQAVDSTASGKLYTADPETRDPYQFVIRSLFGAGLGLGREGFACDTYRVDKKTMEIDADLRPKSRQLLLDNSGTGLMDDEIHKAMQPDSSLTVEQVIDLARLGLLIETHCQRPQEVDFCVDWDARIYLVDTRPIHGLTEYGPSAGNRQPWLAPPFLNGLPEAVTPMHYSMLRRQARLLGQILGAILRLPARSKAELGQACDRLLGYIRGQVFCHAASLEQLVELAPRAVRHRDVFEALAGPGVVPDIALHLPTGPLGPAQWLVQYRRQRSGLARLSACLAAWGSDPWQALAGRVLDGDYRDRSPAALLQTLGAAEAKLRELLEHRAETGLLMLTAYRLLHHACREWCKDESGLLCLDLLRAPAGARFRETLCLAGEPETGPAADRSMAAAEAAAGRMAQALARAGGIPRASLLEHLVGQARIAFDHDWVLSRLHHRLLVEIASIVQTMGGILEAEGVLETAGDIQYLTIEEVIDYTAGTAVSADLWNLARLRRVEHVNYLLTPEQRPGRQFDTYGMVYHRNSYRQGAGSSSDSAEWSATVCSPGEAVGELWLAAPDADPAEAAGRIAVSADPDPRLLAVLPRLAGLICERGNLFAPLCAAARDLAIPVVTGLDDARLRLHRGQRVRLDANAGRILLLKDESSPAHLA